MKMRKHIDMSKGFTPLETYNNTDNKVWVPCGGDCYSLQKYTCSAAPPTYTSTCIPNTNVCTTCISYIPENPNSEYERSKYVGRVVKYNGKKWVAGIKCPSYGNTDATIWLTRITIFGNIKTTVAEESNIKLI